jgi:stage II sporulation protein D
MRAWLGRTSKSHCASRSMGGKNYRWAKTVTVETMGAGLEAAGINVGQIKGLRVLSRGVSGRVLTLAVKGDQGEATLAGELNIRHAFGNLKSSMFVSDAQQDSAGKIVSFHFTGGGFGHGVGMCQSGAIAMAKKRHTYHDILGFYYNGAVVERIY